MSRITYRSHYTSVPNVTSEWTSCGSKYSVRPRPWHGKPCVRETRVTRKNHTKLPCEKCVCQCTMSARLLMQIIVYVLLYIVNGVQRVLIVITMFQRPVLIPSIVRTPSRCRRLPNLLFAISANCLHKYIQVCPHHVHRRIYFECANIPFFF